MTELRNSNNLSSVVNSNTGNTLTPNKAGIDEFGYRWVQLKGGSYWYKVHKYQNKNTIIKNAPFVVEGNKIVGFAPNDNLNRRNVYAILPRENFTPNRRGMSITVERNGPGRPWRLVNKTLANKYNLHMNMGKGFGLWAGRLTRKKNT